MCAASASANPASPCEPDPSPSRDEHAEREKARPAVMYAGNNRHPHDDHHEHEGEQRTGRPPAPPWLGLRGPCDEWRSRSPRDGNCPNGYRAERPKHPSAISASGRSRFRGTHDQGAVQTLDSESKANARRDLNPSPRTCHLCAPDGVDNTRSLGGQVDAPGGIRTPDLRFRRPTLYPAELRAQSGLVYRRRLRSPSASAAPPRSCRAARAR